MKRKNFGLVKLVALLLAVSMIVPGYAFAATSETVQPLASDYINTYNSYICAMGSGKLQIWFRIQGTNVMDKIGALTVMLYESTDQSTWTRVYTFTYDKYTNMTAANDYVHSSYVSYQGVAGRYYKASVCFWAGRDGSGDSRSMWTAVVKAT